MTDPIRISGTIKGTVGNFKARNLDLAFGKNTRFQGDVNMLGLPDFEETFMDFNVRKMTTSGQDIESFRLPGNSAPIVLPAFVKQGGLITVKGKFTGFYNDFVANASVSSGVGNLATDLALIRSKKKQILGYNGKLEAHGLQLGILTGSQDMLGAADFVANINGEGFNLAEADLKLDLRIDSLMVNRYNYSGIVLAGVLEERQFNGKIDINDPNLGLVFTGNVDMRDSIPAFDFDAQVKTAHLFNLNLLKRDTICDFATDLTVNIRGDSPDNLDGTLKMEKSVYLEGKKEISMQNLVLLTRQDTASGKSYHLQSDFLDIDLSGKFSFSSLIPSVSNFINEYLESFNRNDSVSNLHLTDFNQVMNYRIELKQMDEVTQVFLPFMKIAPNSIIHGAYDDRLDALFLKGESSRILINNFQLDDWFLDAETRPDNLSVTSGARCISMVQSSPGDSAGIRMDSVLLMSDIHHDSILYNISWLGKSRPSVIGGFINFINSPEIEIKFSDFDVFLEDKYWSIDPANSVVLDSSSVKINNLTFRSVDQFLKLHGAVSKNLADTLVFDFNKIDISKADKLIGLDAINVDGILHGRVRLTNPYQELMILSDLKIQKFKFNNELLGDAAFNIQYDNEASRINVKSSIIYTGNIGTNIPFNLDGTISLAGKHPQLDLKLALKNLNLKMFNPFVRDFMSGISGLASGEVKIKGDVTRPLINGKLQFMRTEFKINYLNVPYSFADIITIDSGAFYFNKITLFDSLGHKSVVNGKITHDHFTNLALDIYAEMDDFSAYNNVRTRESVFFGKARASGTASITGPVENLRIEVKATNGGKTHITIPIDLTRSVGQADYIIFKDPRNDSVEDTGLRGPRIVDNSGLSLDMALRINDDAEIEVFFPEQLGNLKASGAGNLLMTMAPAAPFTLAGTYKLTKGYFLFQLKNYLRLPMSLMEGSSISWSGDPTDANVYISAMYKTKAPLKGLTTEPSLESTRIPVESIIRIQGKLMSPEISFGMRLPNVEESIKNQVFSVLDTNNPVVMAEQTFYLLVLNQFKPVVGTSTEVDMGSTAFSLVTNQLNSMISQLSTNVSVNMNYKPPTSSTSQEFDVGISTQLFDDRLLIDGTFGMNNNVTTTTQTSTIVGDINIEYVLTKNRRWRVRAFNRTNTTTLLNNNAPYTQGVGLKYQRDFSSFGEIFRFGKKKEK
jgi:hypothetical protein